MAVATVTSGGAGIKRTYATPLDQLSSSQKEPLGVIRREGNKTYKYVLFNHSGVDSPAGSFMNYTDYEDSDVTGDHSDGTFGAGVSQVAIAAAQDNYYGWIQIEGLAAMDDAVDSTGAAGQGLFCDAGTPDNVLEVGDAVTNACCAVMVDASTGAQIVALQCVR